MDFILKKQNKNLDFIILPTVIVTYQRIPLLTHPQKSGTCLVFPLAFLEFHNKSSSLAA